MSASPIMHIRHRNDLPIQENIKLVQTFASVRCLCCTSIGRRCKCWMGKFHRQLNMKNNSPVTVPESRRSITEPVDGHQQGTIISHIHKVRWLEYMSAFLYQQGSSHYNVVGQVMRPQHWVIVRMATLQHSFAPFLFQEHGMVCNGAINYQQFLVGSNVMSVSNLKTPKI